MRDRESSLRRGAQASAVAAFFASLLCCANAAQVDPFSFSSCVDGSVRDLRVAIEAHNESTYKLNRKFKDVWYPQGHAPAEVRRAISLEHVQTYLSALQPRRAAVLLHAADKNRLCSWLVPSKGTVIGHMQVLRPSDGLQTMDWQLLGVRGHARPRGVIDEGALADKAATPEQWDGVLDRISRLLFPKPIEQALLAQNIDTLIVVPISIRRTYDRENPLVSATHADKNSSIKQLPVESRVMLSVGVVPFAALRVRDAILIDQMSITIAPGFFAFAQEPLAPRARFAASLIVGDPVRKDFPALPGARAEAVDIADLLKTQAVVGSSATKVLVQSRLKDQAKTIEFVHLAMHGVADAVNPVDESRLILSDGDWNAREISSLRTVASDEYRSPVANDLPLLARHPVVVMSACQTALGKDFPAGTIGLARAWHWAGASNVVMSLWTVDDAVTRELMTEFVGLMAQGQPVDKALQSAMQSTRTRHPNPGHWASFGIFGAPERLPATTAAQN